MPELSRFYGIVIYMFAKNHLPPHFHAKYAEYIGIFDIETGELRRWIAKESAKVGSGLGWITKMNYTKTGKSLKKIRPPS